MSELIGFAIARQLSGNEYKITLLDLDNLTILWENSSLLPTIATYLGNDDVIVINGKIDNNSPDQNILITCFDMKTGHSRWEKVAQGLPSRGTFIRDVFIINLDERRPASNDVASHLVAMKLIDGNTEFEVSRTGPPNYSGCVLQVSGGVCATTPQPTEGLIAISLDHFWQRNFNEPFELPPIVSAGAVVCVTNGGRVSAVDIATSRLNWEFLVREKVSILPHSISGRIYVAHSQLLTVLDLSTGDPIGKDIDAQHEVIGIAAFADQFVVFATADKHVYCFDGLSMKWSIQTEGVASAFAFEDGRLYVGDDAGIVYALTAKGEEDWIQPLFQRSIRCLLVVRGSVIYGDVNGNIACLAGTNGATLWSVTTSANAPCTTMSLVSDEAHILICDATGRVYKLNISKREFIWEKDVVGSDRSAPVVTDRFVHAGTNAGTVAVLILGLAARSGRSTWAQEGKHSLPRISMPCSSPTMPDSCRR